MKELCNKFRALRIPDYTLVRLFRKLRENSDTKKAENLATEYMNRLIEEFIEKYEKKCNALLYCNFYIV